MAEANPLRILFVEDLPSDEELAKREIRKSGLDFESQRVDTKDAFLRALEEFRPHVIVSDYSMPEFDGMQALKLTLGRDATIPFIILTGSMNEETAVKCLRAGALDYVIKEHITRLPFAVKEALEQRKMRSAKLEAEGALRESEASLQGILRSTADGILAISSDNKVLFANKQFAEMWAIPKDVMASKDDSVLLQHVLDQLLDPQGFLKKVQELYKSNEESFDTLHFKDGRVFERFSRPLMVGGDLRGRVWSFRDVTERKRAEDALRANERRLTKAEGVASFGNWELGIDEKKMRSSEGARLIYGVMDEEMSMAEAQSFPLPEYRSMLDEALKAVMEQGRPYDIEFKICRKSDGRIIDIHSKAEYDPAKKVVFGIIHDITERKSAEERLRASEAYYRTLTEATPDALAIVDTNGALAFASPKALDMFGIPPEKMIIGTSFLNWVSSEDHGIIKSRLQDIFSGRSEPGPREYRLLKNDRTPFWGEINSSPIVDDRGKVVGLLIVCRDITERKQAVEALRESEERYRALIAFSPDALYVHVGSRVALANPTLCQLLHADDPSQLIGRSVYEIVHPDYHEIVRDRLKLVSSGQPAPPLAEKFIRLDGSVVDVEVHAVAIDWQGRKGVQVIARDITERKLAEEKSNQAAEALRQSEARYRAVLQSANDAIITADSNGTITGWNKGAERIFGYTYVEAVGRAFACLLPDGYHPDLVDGIKRLQSGGDLQFVGKSVEVEGVHKDGARFPIELSLSVWEVNEGQFYTGIIRDITDRKRQETAMRESELRFRSVWDRSADGMRLTDGLGRIVDVNEAYCRLSRLTREQLVGEVFSKTYKSHGPSEGIEVYQHRFATGRIVPRLSATIRLWNDEEIDVEISNSFIEFGEGGKYLLSVFRDVTQRNKAEKRLEEERTLLRTIIDAIPDEIAVKDIDRRFMVVNAGTVKALKQASADEIIGKRDEDLIPEHLLKEARWEENAVLAVGGHSQNRVSDKINPETGEIERSLLISKIPLKNDEGKIIGLVGINRDITELKRIEEMLEKERTLLRTLIESIPDEVCLKDLRHRYLVANGASIKALGVTSLDALIGKTDQDFAPPVLAQQHLAEEEAIVASGEPMINREQTRLNPNTGEIEKCALTTKVPVRDQAGKMIGILVVNRNITDRKRAEEGLRASEEKFRTLFEESKDCIYISSADGKLVDINAAGVEMFGYGSKAELLGRDLGYDLYVDSLLRAEFRSRMSKQGFVKDFEAIMKRKDGHKLNVLETATAVRDRQGKVVMHRGTIRDVTNQRQLERQIGQAQKMESLGLLAGGIAHDFNNILGIILGHTAVIERAGNDQALLKDSIGEITTAVRRGASLVRQILTFARKSDAADEPIRVNATITELAKMVDDTFPKTITLSLNLDKTLPIIVMDQSQLHQALLNLCVNARDAIIDSSTGNLGRGTIRIQTTLVDNREVRKRFSEASASEYVCISVSDSGMGMDEVTKQKIFEPFFTTKERGKGTGLGLSVVYGIIKSHHGHIEVESEIGLGTTFRLYLPVTDAVASPAVITQDGIPSDVRGKETILLVEDEENLLGLMKTALEREGYRVLTAMDGVSAIKTFSLNKGTIALVLTDLGLPKLDGAAVFTSMKEIDPNVKIILASGYLEPNLKSNLLRSGAKEFIQKPYSPNLVLSKIREVLDATA